MDLTRFSSSTDVSTSISLDAQRLFVALGLGPLLAIQPCHGYANGCSCERCQHRATWYAEFRERGYAPQHAARLARARANTVRTDAELGYA